MKTVKYSIIIPAYNAESTIRRCVDSALSQDYADHEVIVIDDGSTDKTSNILGEYGKRDIVIKKQENGGVSAARNHGLKLARGEWVLFLDADDWLDESALSSIDEYTKSSSTDCIITRLIEDSLKLPLIEDLNFSSDKSPLIDHLLCEETDNSRLGAISQFHLRCPGGKIIRKSMLEKNNITFPSGITMFEDGIFFLKCFFASNTLLCPNFSFYHYNSHNPHSRTKQSRAEDRKERIVVFKEINNILESNSYKSDSINNLSLYLFIPTADDIAKSNSRNKGEELSNYYAFYRDYLLAALPEGHSFSKRLELYLCKKGHLLLLRTILKAKNIIRGQNNIEHAI